MLPGAFKQNSYKRLRTVALSAFFVALSGCSQPSGFAVHGINMPGGDEDHPAAMRDVATVEQPASMGGTLNALFSFPDQGGK